MTSIEIDTFIKQNYIEMTDRRLSEHVNLSVAVISKRRQRMGLKSPNRSYALYSLPSLPIAANCYELWINGMKPKDISKRVSLSVCTVLIHISKFLPVDKSKGVTITLQSKINL